MPIRAATSSVWLFDPFYLWGYPRSILSNYYVREKVVPTLVVRRYWHSDPEAIRRHRAQENPLDLYFSTRATPIVSRRDYRILRTSAPAAGARAQQSPDRHRVE